MQVDLGTVLSVASVVMSAILGAWVALARVAITNREKEIDRRIDEGRTKADNIDNRLHTEEKATIRQDGEILLVKQSNSDVKTDIDEIKRTMVTKDGFDRLERHINEFMNESRRRVGGAGLYPSGGFTTPGGTKKPDPR